jgi:NADPH:quinone reductase-like Zn-dependent oxidoreductase
VDDASGNGSASNEGFHIRLRRFGWREVKKPDPAAEQALVKVLAVSVNPADWRSIRAEPFFSRVTLGLLRPEHRMPGGDIAGRVQAVGSGVHNSSPATRSVPTC